MGIVHLVGGGPGDPEYLTLLGLRRLREADCVVHDRLIDPRLLDLAPPEAERIDVGKRGGGHYTPQSEIDALLIERAQAGKTVVRLKGGDPLLFGRGGEEAIALRAAGVRFTIVPGVTAAVAAAATAALPLTHRQHASAVAFLTGHEDPSKQTSLDWDVLARFPGTIVVYMGLRSAPAIARKLLEAGRAPDLPVAMVEWAGTNRQQVATRTLDEVARAGVPAELESPVLTIIGSVVDLRPRLDWYRDRPLAGQRVLVLRPAGQADDVTRLLQDEGAVVLHAPTMAIDPPETWGPVDAALERLSEYAWLVFSSGNGVEAFVGRLLDRGYDLRHLGGTRLAAIGAKTAEALDRYFLKADVVPDAFRAEALVAALAPHVQGQQVLLARADRGRDVLPRGLEEAGARTHTVTVYRQRDIAEPLPQIAERLRDGAIDWVLLSSSNIARQWAAWWEGLGVVSSGPRLVSISPVTSETMRQAGLTVSAEASAFTMAGMVAALRAEVGRGG